MSYIFSKTSGTDTRAAGYFRIGCVMLQIPPENISTSHIANNEKTSTLRGLSELFLKTGQARWDIVVRWVALKGDPHSDDYLSQWEQLTDLVAMFKAAPFVEVESPHLRQVMAPATSDRLAVALRQMRVDTHPDAVDALVVTLNMTLFNYAPYSIDFGYQGDGGQASDAYRSATFQAYLDTWKRGQRWPNWKAMKAGVVRLRWRSYSALPTGDSATAGAPITTPAAAATVAAANTPAVKATTATTAGFPETFLQGADARVRNNYEQLQQAVLSPTQAKYGPLQITSGYRNLARNAAAGGKDTSAHLSAGDVAAADIRPLNGNVTGLYNWIRTSGLPYDQLILEYEKGQPAIVHVAYKWNGTNRGMAMKGQTGAAKSYTVESTTPFAQTNVSKASPAPPIALPDPTKAKNDQAVAAQITKLTETMAAKGWTKDYATQQNVFYYKPNSLTVAPSDAQEPSAVPNVTSAQVSVLFVNNLAQIPLASYQYPTYQHVGPCSSLVVMGFESVGQRASEGAEPAHPGLAQLATMAHGLEEQYNQLKATVRQVKSIHQMQAVFVENEVLGLLGITSLMLDQLTTQTAEANLVSASLSAAQYENVFEDLGRFSPTTKHASYRDLGLTDLSMTPGSYFVDHNSSYRQKVRDQVGQSISATQRANETMNTPDPATGFTASDTQARIGARAAGIAAGVSVGSPLGTLVSGIGGVGSDSSVYPVEGSNMLPTDSNQLMQMTHIPGYRMAEAFPTFKLFFIEDGSPGILKAFDNFYSYASVMDIEIIKPKDKPWTMVLQVTNLAHLLNHKVFDDTAEGRDERGLEPYLRGSDSEVTNYAGADIVGKSKGVPVANYGGQRSDVKYFPLQTGTKVELRIGYSNDPDSLTPVFGGTVTEIAGADVLTITCQSFLLELATGSTENVPTNSWWHVGALMESGVNSIPILNHLIPGSVSQGPAYGGVHFLGHDGDIHTVLGELVKDAKAKHFGHWQVKSQVDEFIKGYNWEKLVGQGLSAVGTGTTSVAAPDASGIAAGVVGGALQSAGGVLAASGSRADENILINRSIGGNGSTKGRGATGGEAGGSYPWVPYAYYIDSKCTLSVWELIRDVARRYPEYILAEKLYGFPLACEATLVFGHPMDWYYGRGEASGDRAQMAAADPQGEYFKTWWASEGRASFLDAVNRITVPEWKTSVGSLETAVHAAGQSPAALESTLLNIFRAQSSLAGIHVDESTHPELSGLNVVTKLLSMTAAAGTPGNQGDQLKNLGSDLRNVLRGYQSHLAQNVESAAAIGRIRPIRKYHFIDHNTIVHNGMVVNDKIYNAVRIGDGESNGTTISIRANGSIPDNHIRTLDVTDLINDPKRNVIQPTCVVGSVGGKSGLVMAYAQSFLKEEIGKMYRGEIILRGVPEIEPWDVLLLLDPSTAISGAVEVDQVIHSFTLEGGYITIVKPRAVVGVNEASSAQLIGALMNTIGVTLPNILRLGDMGAAAWSGAGAAAMSGAAAGYGASALLSNSSLASGAAAAVAGAATSGVGAAVTGVLAATAATLGSFFWTDMNSGATPLVITPVLRFTMPWVGGLQGWRVTDMVGIADAAARRFVNREIMPFFELWDTIRDQ